MSIEFLDRPSNSRMSIDQSINELGGSVLYRSKLITPEEIPSYLGLFDQTDEASMYYFQRGYEPEVAYILGMPNIEAVAALRSIGYDYQSSVDYDNGKRTLKNLQRVPSVDTWNNVFRKMNSELYFSDVDGGLYSYNLAEEVYFEDSIIPVSSKEPWRFHDLSIHPIGHYLVSGEIIQEVMNEVSEIRESDSPRNHRVQNHNNLWFVVDNFTEEIAYTFLADKYVEFDKRLKQFIENLAVCLPLNDIEQFKKIYLHKRFLGRIATELNKKASEFEDLRK